MDIEELLSTPYHVIDVLPARVPAGGPGQYFLIERYWRGGLGLITAKQKHLNLILKLNCYFDLSLDGGSANPPPEEIEKAVLGRHVCVLFPERDALIVSEPDDLYLTLCHADGELLELVKTLAAGEGLFVWAGEA